MLDFLKKTSIPKLLDARSEKLIERSYAAGFSVELLIKDLGLIGEAGAKLGAPLPLGSAARQQLVAASALGHGGSDMSAVAEAYVQASGETPVLG